MSRCALLVLLPALAAASEPFYTCQPVNRSHVHSFCQNITLPAKTCVDAAGYHYSRDEHKFHKQSEECATKHKKKEQCPNEPDKCRAMSFNEYCGKYDQSCETDADCVPICYGDCYPCNDAGDCDIMVAFGALAARGDTDCFSVYNHTSAADGEWTANLTAAAPPHQRQLSKAQPPAPPLHKTRCGDDGKQRACRPGEGNPVLTHDYNPHEHGIGPNPIKGFPHEPDPSSPQYAPLVSVASAAAHHHSSLIIMCAADMDYRLIAENWFAALKRLGLSNMLVYSLDAEVHEYLSSNKVHSVDGSANLNAWKATRLVRHIQMAEAERHLAAAALTSSGLNVLLTESTHVMLRDATPMIHTLLKSGPAFDAAFAVSGCTGKPPIGCEVWWNLGLLHGGGTQAERERAVAFQLAGIRLGMVDFYLRWWNGAHCVFSGFGKHYYRCGPKLVGSATPEAMPTLTKEQHTSISLSTCNQTTLGVLPTAFFSQRFFYGNESAVPKPPPLIGRSAKLTGRDRLRLDRYDEQDFVELVASMKADGLWFLP